MVGWCSMGTFNDPCKKLWARPPRVKPPNVRSFWWDVQKTAFDFCKEPACTVRAWLVPIWKDVPCTRPNKELLVSCITTHHTLSLCFTRVCEPVHHTNQDFFGLYGALACRPLWNTRTAFRSDSIPLTLEVKGKDLARLKFRTPVKKLARDDKGRWMYVKSQKTPNELTVLDN